MPKKRRHQGGAIHHGRFEPDEPARLAIRTYLRARQIQARGARRVAALSHERLNTPQSKAYLEYWERVCGWLVNELAGKAHSVDAADWAEASKMVEEERIGVAGAKDETQTIPGME